MVGTNSFLRVSHPLEGQHFAVAQIASYKSLNPKHMVAKFGFWSIQTVGKSTPNNIIFSELGQVPFISFGTKCFCNLWGDWSIYQMTG